jgi:hypothetical protein
LGESFRGEPHALAVGRDLLALIEQAVVGWLPKLFPELRCDPAAATRVIMGQLFSLFIETRFAGGADRRRLVGQRARDIAEVVFPD